MFRASARLSNRFGHKRSDQTRKARAVFQGSRLRANLQRGLRLATKPLPFAVTTSGCQGDFPPRPVEHARAHTEKATVGAVAFRVSDANEYAAGQVEPAAGAYQNVFFTAPGPLPLRYHCGPLVGHVARVKLVCCAGVCNLFPSASMAWKRSRVRISPGPPNSSSTKFVVTVSGVVVNWKSPRDAGLPAKPNASRQAVCSPPKHS